MKKIFIAILCLVILRFCYSQNFFSNHIRTVSGTDTTSISMQGDSTYLYTTKSKFASNRPLYVNGKKLVDSKTLSDSLANKKDTLKTYADSYSGAGTEGDAPYTFNGYNMPIRTVVAVSSEPNNSIYLPAHSNRKYLTIKTIVSGAASDSLIVKQLPGYTEVCKIGLGDSALMEYIPTSLAAGHWVKYKLPTSTTSNFMDLSTNQSISSCQKTYNFSGNSGTGAIRVNNTSTHQNSYGLWVINSGNGYGMYLANSYKKYGLYVNNDSTGTGVYIGNDNHSNGPALVVNNGSWHNADAVQIYGTYNNMLKLINTGNAKYISFVRDTTERGYIDKAINVKIHSLSSDSLISATAFKVTGGNANEFLKGDGSLDSTNYVDTSSVQIVTGKKTFTNLYADILYGTNGIPVLHRNGAATYILRRSSTPIIEDDSTSNFLALMSRTGIPILAKQGNITQLLYSGGLSAISLESTGTFLNSQNSRNILHLNNNTLTVNADTITITGAYKPTVNGDTIVTKSALSAKNYLEIYDTKNDTASASLTWQTLKFAYNKTLSGWTHTAGDSVFICPVTGVYNISYIAYSYRSTSSSPNLVGMRIVNNNVEIAGTGSECTNSASNNNTQIFGSAIASLTAGDVLKAQWIAHNKSYDFLGTYFSALSVLNTRYVVKIIIYKI